MRPKQTAIANVMPGSWERDLAEILGTERDREQERPTHRVSDDMPGEVNLIVELILQALADARGESYDGDDNAMHWAKRWLASPECADLCEGIGLPGVLAHLAYR